jgi:hypothetical protein
MNIFQKIEQPTPFIQSARIFMLVLIIIGIALLCTQHLWVPTVVKFLLKF